jgi:hypothetical protein
MIIRERNRDFQIDGSLGKKLDFDNKDLSTYIFLKTTPFYIKYSIQFFASVVEKETMMDIINGYLCFLENYESEKFNSLKTENGFENELYYDINKIPVTEDIKPIYTQIVEIKNNQPFEFNVAKIKKATKKVSITNDKIENPHISLFLSENEIFVENKNRFVI